MDSGSNTSDTQAIGTANGGSSGSLRQAAQARTSRRNMLRRGGVVAAGAVAGLTLLDQRRAQADDFGTFTLGTSNNATHPTVLSAHTAGQTTVPLFHVNGGGLSGTSTTMIVDGPGALQGKALIVNGNAGGTGIITSAANGSRGTVGLALAASGGHGADAIHAGSDRGVGVRASGKRGGVFNGTAAAIQLAPSAGTHPVHGSKGDLFVDHNAHLFFCRGGTNWVKLA